MMWGVAILCSLLGVSQAGPLNENANRQAFYSGHRLFQVNVDKPIEAELLRALQNDAELDLDFWQEPSLGEINIRVKPESTKGFTEALERARMEFKIVNFDLQSTVDQEFQLLAETAGSTDFTSTYLDLDSIDVVIDDFVSAYPDRVERFNLALTTYEERNIWAVKVSTNLTGSIDKKAVFVECGTHAREFVTISVCLGTINNLASLYNGQGVTAVKATEMLNLYDWYFVPVHNPDGYNYAYTVERFWRKNRRKLRGKCNGVDLNRNWDINWSGTGSSPNKCSNTYHGPSALSEPETSSLAQAVNATANVSAFISLHSYSQLILLPYGYTSVKPDDYNTLLSIALEAEAELESVFNTQYVVGTPPDILYVASGGAYDYMKVVEGIKYAYTYELRPSSGQGLGGFDLPLSQIAPTINETFASLWKLVQKINEDEVNARK